GERAPGAACVLGTADLTWHALVARIAPPAVDPVTARLALRVACARAGAGTTRGMLEGAARYIAEAERAGVPARELDAGLRVAVLGRIHRQYVGIVGASPRGAPPPLRAVEIMPRLGSEPAGA